LWKGDLMARDKIDRTLDPGESEFGGNPDDVRVGIVSPSGAGPNRELISAYWTNSDDSGSGPDAEGTNVGETGAQQKVNGGLERHNQYHLAPPTYPPRYTGDF
jgi:hypothetical protein